MITKLLGFFELEFKQLNEFKLDFFLFWMEALLKCSLMLLFWKQLWNASGETKFSEINENLFMTMILVTQFLLLPYRGSERIAQLIEQPVISGSMSLILCRPIHPILMNLSRMLCVHGRMLIFALSALFFLQYFFMESITGHSVYIEDIQWGYFLTSILLSLLINFFIFTILGIFSFWIGDVWSILYVMGILAGFFSGQFYPLHMNETLEYWSRWFPFRYIGYSPALIYLGIEGFGELLRQLIMTSLLGLACFWGFSLSLRKFEASGG